MKTLLVILILLLAACQPTQQNAETASSQNQKDSLQSPSTTVVHEPEDSLNTKDKPDSSDLIPIEKYLLSFNTRGFLKKEEALKFLVSHRLTKANEAVWEHISEQDTIGKYYKLANGNFIVCISEGNTAHFLLEVSPTSDIIKQEWIHEGNYACCWNSYVDGFNKVGDYFTLKVCGTGSGYCSTHLYVFKDVMIKQDDKTIPIGYSSAITPKGLYHVLDSKMKIKQDQVLVEYTFKKQDPGNMNKVISQKSFDMTYYWDNTHQQWASNDTLKLEGLYTWF